ncbi:hypothetical protein [Microbacterium allomyrinae]|uniref:DUF2188 domain-containing protein n=1 Tax=Microbacterium allomyrinae TaxID=2830666 RepID=A0A9X1LVY9_9MICO|nr:hypothetical protein [Microbacterium allomyrinae]MCC2033097.1 hypothetical protein [Microbacterium allomyrinae]
MTTTTKGTAMPQHYCLTATSGGNIPGEQFTVHSGGGIADAIRQVEKVARKRVSHGRGCKCGNPESKHPGNTVIRDGELVDA